MGRGIERCNHCKTVGISPAGARVNLGVSMFKGGKLYWKVGCDRCGAVDWEYIPPSKIDIDRPGNFMNVTPAYLDRAMRAGTVNAW